MSVSKWRSWPTTRAGSTKGSRRRRYSPLSPGGLGDWLLEVRCMLSTVPPIPTANPVGSGFSLPSGQTEIIDVSTTPVLDLFGNLNNQGTIYLVSTNPLVRSVSISAQNIFDGGGALITTVLPSGGLPGYSNAINDLSLTLVASQSIVNNGSMTSASNLTALAGGTITNAPTVGAQAGLAREQAVGELNLLAPLVVNHGVVSSTSGDVNVAEPSIYASAALTYANGTLPAALSQNITINNTSGTIQALSGTINFGGMELGQTALLSLTGGNLDAQAINLQAGTGAIQADVNNVTGVVNVSGGSAHFASDAQVLDLGSLDVTGDPTFFNMGNIVITGSFTVGQSLAILATGNVTATTAVVIRATNPILGGQNISIVAGANLVPVGSPSGSATLPPGMPLGMNQGLQLRGGSPSGGTISLANSTIDTSPSLTSGNQSGGSVTLVAYGGSGTGGISGVNINSSGAGTGANGGVMLIAGGTVGSTNTAISGIAINASGGTGMPPAAIGIFAAQPQGAVGFDASGIATGSFLRRSFDPRQHSAWTAAGSGQRDCERWRSDHDQDRRDVFQSSRREFERRRTRPRRRRHHHHRRLNQPAIAAAGCRRRWRRRIECAAARALRSERTERRQGGHDHS